MTKWALFQTCKPSLFFKNMLMLHIISGYSPKSQYYVNLYIKNIWQSSTHIYDKIYFKTRNGENFLNWIKFIYKNPPVINITLNCKRMNAIPWIRSGIRQGYSRSALLVNIALDIVDKTNREKIKYEAYKWKRNKTVTVFR